MKQKWLHIDPKDNVAAVLCDIPEGALIHHNNGKPLHARELLKAKHKFALQNLPKGAEIIMYGVTVGKTKECIAAGSPLTVLNTDHYKQSHIERGETPYQWSPPELSIWKNKFWMGYRREDGRYGTRNIWLVIPLVFCENQNVDHMRKIMEEALGYGVRDATNYSIERLISGHKEGHSAEKLRAINLRNQESERDAKRIFKNVDGLRFLNHHSGCGGTRRDSDSFSELIAAYITHPNCAGATVLSLGCQNAEMKHIMQKVRRRSPKYQRKVIWLEQQQFSEEDDFLQTAIKETFISLAEANKCERSEAPLSALSLGLECGGSDGFSGISANPVLGRVADLMNALEANTILSEFPELSGVEENLVNRCVNPTDAERFLKLMHRYHEVIKASGSSFDANPSPGNIRDGLITGAMKSAGAAKKGGSAPITGVLDYTEPTKGPGLHLLCTPGNDVESTTALAATGANIIAFTTGMGTPTGNPLVPVLKVSSNTTLALKMPQLIDFDAGPVIGGQPIDDMGNAMLERIIEIASGGTTKAEQLGQYDFIPWKRDMSL